MKTQHTLHAMGMRVAGLHDPLFAFVIGMPNMLLRQAFALTLDVAFTSVGLEIRLPTM
ncbi:MAG: hypothetical protein WAZ48_11585 [Lysobacteraceae bacterium]